jgi:hypothetical protein
VNSLNDELKETLQDATSLVEDDSAIAAAWLLMIYCHQHGTLHQNNACEGCVLASMINCSGISTERPDPLWNWDVPNPFEVGLSTNQLLWPCDPNLNLRCRKSGCYTNGGPCKHTTNPAFSLPGTQGVPAKKLLATQFEEVQDDGTITKG